MWNPNTWNLISHSLGLKASLICLLFETHFLLLTFLPVSSSSLWCPHFPLFVPPLPVSSSSKVCALHGSFRQTFFSSVLRLRLRRGGDFVKSLNAPLFCASSLPPTLLFMILILIFLCPVWIIYNSNMWTCKSGSNDLNCSYVWNACMCLKSSAEL